MTSLSRHPTQPLRDFTLPKKVEIELRIRLTR